MNECEKLYRMCEFETRMCHLSKLNLSQCKVLSPFNSLGNLDRLQALNISKCGIKKMERLPESLAGLPQLSDLMLLNCNSLKWKEEGQLAILKQLHKRGCKIMLLKFGDRIPK